MKKYLIALIALISLSLNDAGAQTISTEEEDTTQAKKTECRIFECMLESLPTYVGGPQAMTRFLKKNIKYPSEAIKNKQEGRVVVGFYIETDGSLTDIRVIKSLTTELDAEAVRVVKLMPEWIPGRSSLGEPQRFKYNIPITFKLPKKAK